MPLIFNKPLVLGKKAVFNPDAFTVIGNPEITADGIASGFSRGNYLTIPNNLSNKNSWSVIISANISNFSSPVGGNDLLAGQRINCLVFSINTFGKLVFSASSNGTSWNIAQTIAGITTLSINTKYYFKIEFTGIQYKVYYSTDLKTWNLEIAVDSTDKIYNAAKIFIGIGRDGIDRGVQGSIDLKKFKIYVDGAEVFSGSKLVPPKWEAKPFKFDVKSINTVYEYNPDAFTIVGSPEISSNGIASGFSINNYITIPDLHLENADSWEIEGIVNATSDISRSAGAWLSPASGNGLMLPCAYENTGANIQYQLYLSSTDSSWDIAEDHSITFPSGHTVKCNLKFTGTQYIYTCTDLNTDITKTVIRDNTSKIYKSPTQLGLKRNIEALQGSIDLKAFKIYVDGAEVLSGRKIKEE